MEATRERIDLINKIVERAETYDMLANDRATLFMDLRFVDEKKGLRLKALLDADDTNFAHDIYGIQRNFNRETFEMDNFFVPRFSGKE